MPDSYSDDPQSPPALVIDGARFAYPGASAATIDIERFELARGERALMTGGSGTGKSTLLGLISGLLDPDAGEIRVSGEPIHALRGARRDLFRGRRIGVIFQTFNLLQGFSALENVLVAMMFSDMPRSEHTDRARSLLERLGIERTGADPSELSVGQQQRVAVARALACKPDLVLADEPTASLDPENAHTAVTLIKEVCAEQGAALLCVSHDPGMHDRFDRRVDLHELNRSAASMATVGGAGGVV